MPNWCTTIWLHQRKETHTYCSICILYNKCSLLAHTKRLYRWQNFPIFWLGLFLFTLQVIRKRNSVSTNNSMAINGIIPD
ncbi:hypothetical protein T05_9468 [Trichinella murrelli]|uniref:Uncharacterized protein n=1 Tax=Trichinella murrelli TaxID=144512 RepID=A0A0V0T7Z3_9BILA|nr:hypothetical protein T05_9468 [Trichinella murrelli]